MRINVPVWLAELPSTPSILSSRSRTGGSATDEVVATLVHTWGCGVRGAQKGALDGRRRLE